MLGILYDIHGNLDALNAVLADADDESVDRWLLGGDYGTPSPHPIETLARLRERPPLRTVCVERSKVATRVGGESVERSEAPAQADHHVSACWEAERLTGEKVLP